MYSGLLLQITKAGEVAADTLSAVNGEMVGEESISMSFLDLALKGGWILGVLLILSIIGLYIFFERYFAITKASREDKNFMNNIRDFIHDDRLESAVTLCNNNDTPIARMIEKGLKRIGKPLSDITVSIENAGRLEVSRLERGIAMIATISGAAPMLGFLGTVMGMIRAFYDMSMAGNNIDIALLSSGIYQAMVTTVAGLIVGVIAYITYNIIVSKIERLVFKLEARATEFMDVLNEPAKG